MTSTGHPESIDRAPRARSALFVPANRADMLGKASRFGPDIVLADLEDSVPAAEKEKARHVLLNWLDGLADEDAPNVAVRINGLETDSLDADLGVCIHPRVSTVMVPKVEAPSDVERVAESLLRHEQEASREQAVFVWPIIETAAAVRTAYEIATSSTRVRYVGGSAGDEGDLARSLGFQWTPSFNETLFVRSKVLVDVRAAGINNPMTGVVTNITNPDEIEAFATQSRDLGYSGMMVIHPSHVPVVNAIFGVSAERIEWAKSVIAALEVAAESGVGAVRYEGTMIDVAMDVTARNILKLAEEFKE